MRAPYGLNIIDNCLSCPVREEHLFCNLPVSALKTLNEIKSTAIYPKIDDAVYRGSAAAWGVCALCRKGQTLHFFERGQDHHYEDFGSWGCPGSKRDHFQSAL